MSCVLIKAVVTTRIRLEFDRIFISQFMHQRCMSPIIEGRLWYFLCHLDICRPTAQLLHSCYFSIIVMTSVAPCALRRCKNWPAPFPGQMSYKATKPGYFCFMSYHVLLLLLFIRTPFYVLLVCVGICCLLVVLVKFQYLPSDRLERLLWGSLTVEGSSPKAQVLV